MLRAMLTNQHDGNECHVVEAYTKEQLLISALDSLGWSLLGEVEVCDECHDEEPVVQCEDCGKKLCDDCKTTQDGYEGYYCESCRPSDPSDSGQREREDQPGVER